MAAYIERRRTRAAGWARRLGAFSLVLLLTAGVSRRYGLLEPSDFFLVARLVAGLALLALACAAYAFSRFWNDNDLGGRDLSVGAILALAALMPFAVVFCRAIALPIPADISTDTADPPALVDSAAGEEVGAQSDALVSDAPSSTQADIDPAIRGRRYDLSVDQMVEVANALVARQGWIVRTDARRQTGEKEITIEARAATPILAFPTDIAVRVADESGSAYVDMRAVSPYGGYDLGDNAALVADFLAELDTEIARRPEAVPPSE
ncbi:DUF1499 domain-containing protein [Mesorhizobium sp. CN2-181]|uniref:DUF1499 domain-containing protein n=1 Tax=Mesorhizobium yinganensis TaxID=3157707 RepID=UPI0032B754C3